MDVTAALEALNRYLHAFPDAVTHAATLGGDDYLRAAADRSGKPYMDRVGDAHAKRAAQEADMPTASTIGSLVGSLLNTPGGIMGSGVKAALINGGMGAIQGAADSEGDVGTTLAQGGISAALPTALKKGGSLASQALHAGETPKALKQALDNEIRGQGPDLPDTATKLGQITQLRADRAASDAGGLAAGSPARSFSDIAKDADVSNVHPFPVPDSNYKPTHTDTGLPYFNEPSPPKPIHPWDAPDNPALPENMVSTFYDPARHGSNLDDYLKKPLPSDSSKSLLDALNGVLNSGAREASKDFGPDQANAAPTAYDKWKPLNPISPPMAGSDVDSTLAIDTFKSAQHPLSDNIKIDDYKKYEMPPMRDDLKFDDYKKYEVPPLRDDLTRDEYKKYLAPSQ